MFTVSINKKSFQCEDDDYSQHGKYQQGFPDIYKKVLHQTDRVASNHDRMQNKALHRLALHCKTF